MRGGVFNVGDESMNCTKRAVAEKIREYVDYYLHEADVGKDLDARDYEVDYSRIKKLGYRATVSMDEGVRELIKTLSVLNVINPLRNA
jgi:nucleoside-diphosphate-sugar epimerase